ncbi:hypothetical protein IED13_01020 [Bosea sp. SSUT16]|uniref:Uncharacterized protein n=1 Tax=Bosea spartocytisi TaxID=2773451 RepID=A0A927E602_9HYPH|nr:hypothetical protein [Bosea spartocytisi]MBD3844260.1 hypothetical protein [Bosea spartocytisi]MCT4470634.1 hypothetical protein [Bosea spartocytisi]
MIEENETVLTDADLARSDDPKKNEAEAVTPEAAEDQSAETEQVEGEETEGAEDEGGDKDDEGERPRKKSRSERLRSQLERLRAENAALRSGSAASAVADGEGIDAEVVKRIGKPPKEEDFAGDYFAYDAARQAYEVDKRLTTRQVSEAIQQRQEGERTRVAELIEDYQDHCAEAAKAMPDFFKVVQDPGFVTSDLVKRFILDAGDKGPLVAYHLAKNPRLTARINALGPIDAAREMGRIEGMVSPPKARTATSAKPPVQTPKGSAAPRNASSDLDAWLSNTYGNPKRS